MESFESAPAGVPSPEEALDDKIVRLLDGPPSNNYNYRQIQLAVESFRRGHPGVNLSRTELDGLMMEWVGSERSRGWGQLVRHSSFQTHSRFQGDIAKVTLEDLETFIETGELPKK